MAPCLLLALLVAVASATSRIIGGKTPVDPLDAAVLQLAGAVSAEYDLTSASAWRQGVVRVVEGTKQVVSGMSYDLTVELGDSACAKGSAAELPCPPLQGATSVLVHANVWVQPWKDFTQVTIKH